MRPVNLIPPDERRGDSRSPTRMGPLVYIIVGALAVGLVGVVVVAVTSKQISDKQSEKQNLQVELDAATAKAQSLRAFADFRGVQEQRTATVASLAESRFDWERVMNELALVIPDDIWLVKLTGSVSPQVQIEGGADIATRDSVAGPALEIIGCGPSQDSVAGFLAALEDIDGVTRVGVRSSRRGEDNGAAAAPATAAGQSTTEDCRTKSFIYQFEIVVAFDAVPTPATATAAPGVPAPAAPTTGGTQLAGQTNSAAEQTAQAQRAEAKLIPGGN
jgi:Tfp pilus assembly protein PilN